MKQALLLDSHYIPLMRLDVKKALLVLYTGRAIPVEVNRKETIAHISLSPTRSGDVPSHLVDLIKDNSFEVPEVIRLTGPVSKKFMQALNSPTRNGVFRREGYSCIYCGDRSNLTIDHVIPSSRGGDNSWTNLVACCFKCNNRKGNRTPEEANMRLRKQPLPPSITVPTDFWTNIIG